MRPDVPALMFTLMSFYILFISDRGWAIFFSGVIMGISLLYTPKTVFALIGLLITIFLFLRYSRQGILILPLFLTAMSVPVVLSAFYLYTQNALSSAVFFNYNFNIMIPYTYQWYNVTNSFLSSFTDNTLFWSMGVLALVLTCIHLFRNRNNRKLRCWQQQALLVGFTLGGILGIMTIQVPLKQYFMIFVVPISILIAYQLSNACERFTYHMGKKVGEWTLLLFVFFLLMETPIALTAEYREKNDRQLQIMRFVWESTEPNDVVFDCWTGLYVFGSSCNRVGKKQHKIGIDWLWIMRNRVFIGIRNLA